MQASVEEDKSLYAALGVAPDATDDEIKRAFRQLATMLHPDKVQDAARHDEAARLFATIQEAYEILSDPQRRDIYDIYGKEGLSAGLEVGERVKSKEELRKDWEAFQAKQRRELVDAEVNYRGVYVFKTDASALVNPYDPSLARKPELTSIYMTSGLDVPIDTKDWGLLGAEHDVAHLGGLVSVRCDRERGGGSILAGYRRVYSDGSRIDLDAAVGLRTLLSVQSSVPLSEHSSATLAATWQPQAGLGLQFVTQRQLSAHWSGEYSWVVGPAESSGMSVGLTWRGEKTVVVTRVEVGTVMGIVGRVVRQLGESASVRLGFKATTAGLELDVGGSRRVSEATTGGMSVVVGLQGLWLKVRFNRAGHLFEFPILLSPSLEASVLAGAYTLPPLALCLLRSCVLGPLSRTLSRQKARKAQREQAHEINTRLQHAAMAAQLIAPVAQRRMAREHAQGGLVVALALYGAEEAVHTVAKQRRQQGETEMAAKKAGEGVAGVRAHPILPQQPGAAARASTAAEGAAAHGSSPANAEQQQQEQQQGKHEQQQQGRPQAQGQEEEAVPPAVVDVTTAVQYLVSSSKVAFHRGYPKSGLMGFCDPAPQHTKLLLLYYTYKGHAYRAQISDQEGAVLPGRGTPLAEEEGAPWVLWLAAQQARDQRQEQQQQQQQGGAFSAAAGGRPSSVRWQLNDVYSPRPSDAGGSRS